jgi:5-methylthioadenosine/S-adenosylhomocysteine deaminase
MLDMLIHGATVITMQGEGTGVIPKGAVGIKGDKICCVGEDSEILKQFDAHRHVNASGKVVLPGFVDSHTHSADALLRGTAQDIDLWLEKGIGPFMEVMSGEHRAAASALHILEGLKNGITCYCDFYYPMAQIVNLYEDFGLRARVATMITELPPDQYMVNLDDLYSFDRSQGATYLQDNLDVMDRYGADPANRLSCMFGPQGLDMVSRETMLEIKGLAGKYGAMIHIHLMQTPFEVYQVEKRYGVRPVDFLEQLGMLNDRTLAAHLIESSREETAKAASSGVRMAFCPYSLGIIAGVVPPVVDFIEAGGIAGLGTDGAAGNNQINMFSEMKFASVLNKVKFEDAKVMPAWKCLRLATIEAAQAIGLGDQIGSIEVGKKADVIIVGLGYPNLRPIVEDPIRTVVPNLVYSGNGKEVEMVIVDGKVIMEDRNVLTVDEEEIIKNAQAKANDMAKKATPGLIRSEATILSMMEKGQY